jgi:hypothetical protein
VSGKVTVVPDFKRTHFYSEGTTLSQDGGMMLLDYADPDQGGTRLYPPSGVKRPSERRYKPYIVVLLVRLGTLPARQLPGRFAIGNLTGPEA